MEELDLGYTLWAIVPENDYGMDSGIYEIEVTEYRTVNGMQLMIGTYIQNNSPAAYWVIPSLGKTLFQTEKYAIKFMQNTSRST